MKITKFLQALKFARESRVETSAGPDRKTMPVTFVQTADPIRYRPMLEMTSATIREYIARHGGNYVSFVGLKRGSHAWQATFNRIVILKSLMDEGLTGWVIYVDADAYIHDLNFDLQAYLADKSGFAMIAAPSGIQPPRWWDVNAGVFAINLGHALGRRIVVEWNQIFSRISDEALMLATVWDAIPNDQNLLHEVLQNIAQEDAIFIDREPRVLNWGDGSFIRQVVRSASDHGSRLSSLSRLVADVLGEPATSLHGAQSTTKDVASLEEEFITTMYRVFLLRNPDRDGLMGALKRLRKSENTFEQEMRSCLRSSEFSQKLPRFLAAALPPGNINSLLQDALAQVAEPTKR